MQLLLDYKADTSVNSRLYEYSDPLLGAITECREDAASLLMDAGAKLLYKSIIVAATSLGNARVVDLVLRRDPSSITKDAIVAAASNGRYGREVAQLLLAGTKIEIPKAAVKAAARNWKCGNQVMELLLARDNNNNIRITEAMVKVAAENERCGNQVMKLLLARNNDIGTEAVVRVAAENEGCGNQVMKLLLARDNIGITEAVVRAAAKNEGYGNQLMELFLAQDTNMEITKAMMIAAAGNDVHRSSCGGSGGEFELLQGSGRTTAKSRPRHRVH
jgi:hypothetical protein